MARITVEDCIDIVNNQYDLVILAKERAVQLGRGAAPAAVSYTHLTLPTNREV